MSKNLLHYWVVVALVSTPMTAWGEDCSYYQQQAQANRNAAQKNRANGNSMRGNRFAQQYYDAANAEDNAAAQYEQKYSECSGGSGSSSSYGSGNVGGGSGYSGAMNAIDQFKQQFMQQMNEERAAERRQSADKAAAEEEKAAERQQAADKAAAEAQRIAQEQQSKQRAAQNLNNAIDAQLARDELNNQLDAQLQSSTPRKLGTCDDGSSPVNGLCPDLVFPSPQKQVAADKVANVSLNDQMDKAMAEDAASQKFAKPEQNSEYSPYVPYDIPFSYKTGGVPAPGFSNQTTSQESTAILDAEQAEDDQSGSSSPSVMGALKRGKEKITRTWNQAKQVATNIRHPFKWLDRTMDGATNAALGDMDNGFSTATQ